MSTGSKTKINVDFIGHVRTPFPEKFGVPRQSGMIEAAQCEIELSENLSNEELLRGLENFDRLWVIFYFHLNRETEPGTTVRPPRLGGNKRLGIFATRTPYRPNPMGLSCVTYHGYEKRTGKLFLKIGSTDVVDGTPVLDIKPYIPEVDSFSQASGGWTDELEEDQKYSIEFTEEALEQLSSNGKLKILIEQTLSLNPLPRYQNSNQKEYGISLKNFNIRFKKEDSRFIVLSVQKLMA